MARMCGCSGQCTDKPYCPRMPPEQITYECWGCGESFTFRALADIDFEGEPCPNRCGNVLSPGE